MENDEYLWPSELIILPCGGSAILEAYDTHGYRCVTCFAVIGSMGQSTRCKEEAAKYDNWKKLGGTGWDYKLGRPEKTK